MSHTEEYTLFHLAAHFLEKENFTILHMNQSADELWLIKLQKKQSNIIRLAKHGFNWKNELKKDITNVFRRIELMSRSFSAKKVEIYNIYITKEEPVDDWKAFKNPITLNQKEPIMMNVFYLTSENLNSEKTRLLTKIQATKQDTESTLSKQEQRDFVKLYKTKIGNQLAQRSEAEQRKIKTYGKARINYLFISINLILFTLFNLVGKNYFQQVYELSLFNQAAILDGEWWRMASSLFIHHNIYHLVLTVLILYYLGTLIENNYGSLRFVIIFLLAGIGANLTSFAFSSNNLVQGSTGALFGLLGALLVFSLYYQRLYFEKIGKNIIIGFIFIVLLSIIFPQYSIYPYVGSFIFGFITANLTYLPNRKSLLLQASSGVLLLLLFALLTMIGFY